MPIKFLLLGGGGFGGFFRRGGWKCQFYFYGRGDFSERGCRTSGCLLEGVAVQRGVAERQCRLSRYSDIIVFQLQPIPPDSSIPTTDPRVVFESILCCDTKTTGKRPQNDSKTTPKRLEIDSPEGGLVLGVDESGRMGCSWKTLSLYETNWRRHHLSLELHDSHEMATGEQPRKGPEETSRCSESRIAAQQFLPLNLSAPKLEAQRPTQNPEIPKNAAFTRTFSKSSRELSCDANQEPDGNCSGKLVQMNFFILGGFFWVDFPPVKNTNRKSLVISNRGVQIARISPKSLSKMLQIAVQIARFVIWSLFQIASKSLRRALQIASDLRFAIRISNRNRTKSRDLEHLVLNCLRMQFCLQLEADFLLTVGKCV